MTLTPDRRKALEKLFTSLQIPFPTDYLLFHHALTHSSFTYENHLPSLGNYERLEFLGDAVLKLAISHYLYDRFPEYREGDLTKIRAVIVSDALLAEQAKKIGLEHFIVFGASEARNGGKQKTSNLACAFEAFLGALYLDGKQAEAHDLILSLLAEEVTRVDLSKTKQNYKAVLQELTQGQGDGLPIYTVLREEGPSHRKTFTVEVLVNGEVVGIGTGATKKEAQQQAAKVALDCLNEQTD